MAKHTQDEAAATTREGAWVVSVGDRVWYEGVPGVRAPEVATVLALIGGHDAVVSVLGGSTVPLAALHRCEEDAWHAHEAACRRRIARYRDWMARLGLREAEAGPARDGGAA